MKAPTLPSSSSRLSCKNHSMRNCAACAELPAAAGSPKQMHCALRAVSPNYKSQGCESKGSQEWGRKTPRTKRCLVFPKLLRAPTVAPPAYRAGSQPKPGHAGGESTAPPAVLRLLPGGPPHPHTHPPHRTVPSRAGRTCHNELCRCHLNQGWQIFFCKGPENCYFGFC